MFLDKSVRSDSLRTGREMTLLLLARTSTTGCRGTKVVAIENDITDLSTKVIIYREALFITDLIPLKFVGVVSF
jgi:hypothetical protein